MLLLKKVLIETPGVFVAQHSKHCFPAGTFSISVGLVVFTTYTLATNKSESQPTFSGIFFEVNTIPTSDGGMICAHDPNSLYSQIAQPMVYSNLYLSPKPTQM